MSIEKPTKPKYIPTLELTEIEREFMSPAELHARLRELAEKEGLSPEDLLYTGIDESSGQPFEDGFGDRTMTWAVTDAEFAESIDKQGTGSPDSDSPLFYAFEVGNLRPAVIVLDRRKFVNMSGMKRVEATDEWDAESNHTDEEYRLKDGNSFDDAVVAALRIVE